MNQRVGRRWDHLRGTCSEAMCDVPIGDDQIWCDEHLALFRDRLRQASASDPKRRREEVEYIEQWLARMKARAQGGGHGR